MWSQLLWLGVVVAIFAIVWHGGEGCGHGLCCIGGSIVVGGVVWLLSMTFCEGCVVVVVSIVVMVVLLLSLCCGGWCVGAHTEDL